MALNKLGSITGSIFTNPGANRVAIIQANTNSGPSAAGSMFTKPLPIASALGGPKIGRAHV